MLVIEGRHGKSIFLEQYVNELCEKVNPFYIQVIDYVGVPYMFGKRVSYCSKGDDMTLDRFPEDFRKWNESFQSSKYLILELNAPKQMLDKIKDIERDFNKQVVVTIQNNDLDQIDVYEY